MGRHARTGSIHETRSQRTRPRSSDLAATLVHQLSQPLTVLQGEMELVLQSEHTAAEYRALLEASLIELDRLSRVVHSFREMEEMRRPASGSHDVPLVEVVSRAAEVLTPIADRLGVGIQIRAERECYVKTSWSRFEKAITKTLDRALARSPRRSDIEIAVSTNKHAAIVAISDQGPCSTEDLDWSVVAPGLDSGPEKASNWVVARRMIESLDGTFEVRPRFGEGCMVRMTLPLSRERNWRRR